MIKFVKLALVPHALVVEGQKNVQVRIPPHCLRDWCLCLQLLSDNSVETCIFADPQNRWKLKLATSVSSADTAFVSSNTFDIQLTTRSLDYVRGFFLRYYRDGVATVNHIDIEDDTGGYITLLVDEYRPPISPDEAKKLLDQDE